MTKSSPLPQAEAAERLLVLFGRSIPHPSSLRRSSAVTSRWLRTSSLARQSPGEIQALPTYGSTPAGRNKRGFRPSYLSNALIVRSLHNKPVYLSPSLSLLFQELKAPG